MNVFETIGFLVVILSALCGIFSIGYFAFCGVRQYIDDARTGARYRVEDEEFRRILKGQK